MKGGRVTRAVSQKAHLVGILSLIWKIFRLQYNKLLYAVCVRILEVNCHWLRVLGKEKALDRLSPLIAEFAEM